MSNDTDRLVSDTYSELADEKTPDALNREILRLAAKEGRTRYSIARAWMRPVAWAATIGLSLVLVLELTNLPGSDMTPLPQPAAIDAAPEAAEPEADRAKEQAVFDSQALEERADSVAKRSRPYAPEEQKAEKVAVLNVAPAVSGNEMRTEPEPADQPAALEADDRGEMQETMERARQLARGPSRVSVERAPEAEQSVDSDSVKEAAESALRVESFASATTSLSAESDFLCPLETRLSAEKWLECIEKLEADSPPELIEKEYEELRKSYPDFELPAADK